MLSKKLNNINISLSDKIVCNCIRRLYKKSRFIFLLTIDLFFNHLQYRIWVILTTPSQVLKGFKIQFYVIKNIEHQLYLPKNKSIF